MLKKEFFLSIISLDEGGILNQDCSFCNMANDGFGKGENLSPGLIWGNAPDDTKSFAIVFVDIDVPTDLSQKNQEGVFIPAEQKRTKFIHWLACDIDKETNSLPKGYMSKDLTNKEVLNIELVNGKNDYSKYVDEDTLGYWGPCSPTNDLRLHRYILRLYALNAASLNLNEGYDYEQFIEAIKDKILAQANSVVIYTRNALLISSK